MSCRVVEIPKLQIGADSIRVEYRNIQEPKTPSDRFWGFIKDVGLPGASIAIALAVGIVGYLINDRDAAIKQSALLSGYLTELLSTDVEKHKTAAIKLAEYGDEAKPVVLLALGSSTENERQGPILAVKYMFEWGKDTCRWFFGRWFFETTSEKKRICRSKLLDELLGASISSNPYLRAGALEGLLAVADALNDSQKLEVLETLKDRLGPQGELADQKEKEGAVMQKAVLLLAKLATDEAAKILVGLVRNSHRPSVQVQSLESLEGACKNLAPPSRQWVLDELKKTLPQSQDSLRSKIDTTTGKCEQTTVSRPN